MYHNTKTNVKKFELKIKNSGGKKVMILIENHIPTICFHHKQKGVLN